jgi:hypothetical protein
VLDDLQAAAHTIRQRLALGRQCAGDPQHGRAYGVGRQPAVVEQLVPRRLADDRLVAPVGGDEVEERRRGHVGGGDRPAQPGGDRMAGPTLDRGPQVALQPVEGRRAIAGMLIAEVVGQASEGVDGEQLLTGFPGHEPGDDGKVLVVSLGDEPRLRRQDGPGRGAPRLDRHRDVAHRRQVPAFVQESDPMVRDVVRN